MWMMVMMMRQQAFEGRGGLWLGRQSARLFESRRRGVVASLRALCWRITSPQSDTRGALCLLRRRVLGQLTIFGLPGRWLWSDSGR